MSELATHVRRRLEQIMPWQFSDDKAVIDSYLKERVSRRVARTCCVWTVRVVCGQ